MSKSTNNTNKTVRTKKNVSLFKDSKTFFAYRHIPMNEVMVTRLQDDLLQWYYRHPNARGISKFYIERGIDPKTYYRLIDKHNDLKEIHEFILQCIGERLWEDALDKKKGMEWAAARYRLWRCGKEFKEDAEFNAALKAGEDSRGGIVYVRDTIPVSSEPPRFIGM